METRGKDLETIFSRGKIQIFPESFSLEVLKETTRDDINVLI